VNDWNDLPPAFRGCEPLPVSSLEGVADEGSGEQELRDEAMLEEIELVSDLVVAVSASGNRPLTQQEIDRALGVAEPDRPL
jgi:N-acetylmuramic acid 6-phosphate (MurNAc-6-P) etherase